MLFLDIECYSNYFLISFLHHKTGKIAAFELHDTQPLQIDAIKKLMNNYTTVSFNGLSYDLPMIAAALKGFSNARLKTLSDSIIKSNLPSWRVCKEHNIFVPKSWDHIDLIEVAPGQASLKIYGGRMNAPKMQDLPLEPNAIIQPEQFELMREYCANDLRITQMLYGRLEGEIELRKSMSEQYGVDLRSKGGAQVAKAVIGKMLQDHGIDPHRVDVSPGTSYKYSLPKFIKFESATLKSVLEKVVNADFFVQESGQIKLPSELDEVIEVSGKKYKFGIGGLHSQEECQAIIKKDNEILEDRDVASMYPNIILRQGFYPKHLTDDFLSVYRGIVDRRIRAKRSGDKLTADSLKLVINSSFGLFGSKYSFLYSPDLLIQTTVSGQLLLLMLIERLSEIGVEVVSANTDGIVLLYSSDLLNEVESVCFGWEMEVGLELETTDYAAIYSASVNNYLAVTKSGKVKRKGVFSEANLSKNPDLQIIYNAAAEYLSKGVAIEETITKATDITKFVSVRRVQGGAIWRDQLLGKAVRFYYSSLIPKDECIRYAKNTNKVPKSDGSRPLMDLPDDLPQDIDYDVYIKKTKELLKTIGL